MFSCFFLEDDKILKPTKCELRYISLGLKCSGTASIRLDATNRPVHNTVLYVPSLVCHSTGARCELRLTGCRISTDSPRRTEELTITKCQEAVTSSTFPVSYAEIKTNIGKLVLNYGAAQSPSDVILLLGDLDNKSSMNVQLTFIMNISPALNGYINKSTNISWYYIAMLPSSEVSLKVSMEIPHNTHLASVVTTAQDSTLSQTMSDRSVTVDMLHSNTSSPDTTCPGVVIILAPCASLLSQSHTVLLNKSICVNEELVCDGVQMVDYLFAPEDDNRKTSGEYIFMVDCSGSMSGLRIQNASESLILAIKSLPNGCYFNVVAFGSKFRILFQSSMDVSHKNIAQGVHFANQLRACLGGTELLTPIRWVFKRPPQNGLGRHFFLITDGGVPNVPTILQTVSTQRHNTRLYVFVHWGMNFVRLDVDYNEICLFHTFALGPEICCELMAGLAAETNGQYRVITETDRLQARVMEVLQISLTPALQNVSVTFSPPTAYTAMEDMPLTAPSAFPRRFDTNYVLLKKSPHNGSINTSHHASVNISSDCSYECITVPSHTELDASSGLCITVLQSAAWKEMATLEERLLLQPRHHQRSSLSDEVTPPTKVPCWNGVSNIASVREELTSISIRSGVTYYPHTHFQSSSGRVYQITPWNSRKLPTRSQSLSSGNISVNVPIRKRPRDKINSSPPATSPSLYVSSLARQTASGIGMIAKATINLVTLGYVTLDSEPVDEAGHRIEDQEYYQNKADRIHWDKHHQLILPDLYYTSTPNQPTIDASSAEFPTLHDSINNSDDFHFSEDGQPESIYCNREVYYIPLVELQLPSGAWPLETALTVVTGVSMKKITELPMSNGSETHFNASQGHIWATALALAFLKTHCAHFEMEWRLLASKGQEWLDLHTDASLDIDKTALDLLLKS